MISKTPNIELSIVIPVYNSASTLEKLSDRLRAVLNTMGITHEIVFVDDGSADDSWQVLSDIQGNNRDRIIAVQLMRNSGQHNALMCGFRHSSGQYVVTMDDDLQNPPEEIPKLLNAIRDGEYDLVYGVYDEKQHAAWRNMGSHLIVFFYQKIFGTTNAITSFRAIRRKLLESIFTYQLNFTFLDGLLAWNTQRIAEVTVEHNERKEGRSGYSLRKLIGLAFNLFANFSLLPLQLTSIIGCLVAILGFGMAGFYLIQTFRAEITVPGYASTIVAVLFLGGIQLLALGIIGEYLGRMHMNVNRKPQYSERKVLDIEQ